MRSLWKGSISFGLVSIPVQLYGATENHSVSFHQIHLAEGCGGRIRYRKVCEIEEVEVPSEEIGKGFTDADGDTAVLTDEDFASLPLPTARTIEILSFLPAEDIDPIQLDRAYYLGTDTASAAKPYVLLREALARTGKAAMAKFALRGRESLGLLRVIDDTLVLHSMLWPDEVRSAGTLAPSSDVTVRDAELAMAETLMDSLGDLDWSELHDEYREAVEELVAAKLQGREPAGVTERPTGGKVLDLMSALESSVAAAREGRDGDAATVTAIGSGARKGGKTADSGEDGGAAKGSGSGTGGGAAKTGGAKKGSGSATKAGRKKAATKTAATKTAGKSGGGAAAKTAVGGGGGRKAAGTAAASRSGAKTARGEGAQPSKRAASAERTTRAADAGKGSSTDRSAGKKAAPRKRAS